jgi:hypothetical protein
MADIVRLVDGQAKAARAMARTGCVSTMCLQSCGT